MTRFYQGLIAVAEFLQSFFLLAVRLFWGWQFFASGWGKLQNIDQIAEFFGSIGIHPALLNAYAASSIEFVGGALLLVGFASRLAAIPLMVTMVVALLTAHREATLMVFNDPNQLLSQLPVTFFLASLIIFLFGPGKFSIDALIKRQWT